MDLHESGPIGIISEAGKTGATPGRMTIQLITPGWGSSGYYSAEMLEAAAKAKVFPAGLQMYVDHPSESEKWERPERSIRDLGAVLVSDGSWDPTRRAIVAETQVFSTFAGALGEMRDAIGVSIRGAGTSQHGEAEGRSGPIVTSLESMQSVDFVTQAGRGGRILEVLESQRPSKVNARAVAHGVSEATANDTRDALDTALTDKFGGTDTWVWVQDFDAEQVWYQVSTPDSADTFQLDYSIDDAGVVTLSDDSPTEVTRKTTYVPVSSAGGNTPTTESTPGVTMEITEAEHRRLTEAATALTAAEARATKAEQERDADRAKLAEADARKDATERAGKLLESVEVRNATKARIVESVVVGLPMTDWKLDVAAFESRVAARAASEATYEATLLAEAGAGTPSGEGGKPPALEGAAAAKAVEAAEAVLVKEFQAMGLSEAQAKTAAAGRG